MERLRILIVRPDRLGDAVLSTPLPREIKKVYPDAYVAVLIRKPVSAIYLNNPNVDEIILFDEMKKSIRDFFEQVKEIWEYKFTHAFMLLPNERINYILFFAGIKKRYGAGHKLFQLITFTKGVSRHKYIPLRHEADYCLDFVRKLGIETNDHSTEIFLTDREKEEADELRKEQLEGKKYLVGIHASSGKSAPNWMPGEYKKLIDKLLEIDSIQVVATDIEIPPEIENIKGVKYPHKNLTLRQSILHFSAMDMLISASTGPMHVCAALKVKTVSLFCPLTACSPKLWGPAGNESIIAMPDENYCSHFCPSDPKICTFTAAEGGLFADRIFKIIVDQFDL